MEAKARSSCQHQAGDRRSNDGQGQQFRSWKLGPVLVALESVQLQWVSARTQWRGPRVKLVLVLFQANRPWNQLEARICDSLTVGMIFDGMQID